ncbi:extracellular solute-binding protein [candidate division WWE3 bacterium]|uniref:Extracellular solute-binding protein n=1 Tax=candidate division WWE3 bacterium TaxID=2053526 RepID=A0A955LK38_UNCKA|nr:extracellular solute-binding protein [candidate division WWE3 bacterium]
MRKALIFVAVGLILLGVAGLLLFPDVRSDIIGLLPFINREPKSVTLKYWGLWEPRQVIQPLLDQYQKENPNVTIEYEQRDPGEYYQLIDARLGVDGGPDIVRLHDSWVPAMRDRLAPVPKGVMDTATYESIFYPVNSIFLKQNDTYYAMPLMIDGLALVYNRNLFEQNGFTDPPKDWREFRQYAQALTKKNSSGQIVQSGAALGFANDIEYSSDILGLMMAQNGVQFESSAGKVTFQSTLSDIGQNLGVEALQFYTLFATSEQSWNPDWGNSTQEFASGRVAMVFLPSHRIQEVLNRQPSFSIGVAAVPQLPDSSTSDNVAWANYWVESVSKNSANSEAAWEFVKWMAEKEQLSTFYRLASDTRSFGEPYPRSDLAASLSDIYTLPYVSQGPYYSTWYLNDGVKSASLNDTINDSIKRMIENVAGGAKAETELQQAANEVQTVLDGVLK